MVTLFNRRYSQEKSPLILSAPKINWQTCSQNPSRVLVLMIFFTSLVHITYMLQLEGECEIYVFNMIDCIVEIRDSLIISHY